MAEIGNLEKIRVALVVNNNETFQGSVVFGDSSNNSIMSSTTKNYDEAGASTYIVTVVLVYGFSIVLLIASHIFFSKKGDKGRDGEDKQITRYLEEIGTLRETQHKETFLNLKKSIMPLIAIGYPYENKQKIEDEKSGPKWKEQIARPYIKSSNVVSKQPRKSLRPNWSRMISTDESEDEGFQLSQSGPTFQRYSRGYSSAEDSDYDTWTVPYDSETETDTDFEDNSRHHTVVSTQLSSSSNKTQASFMPTISEIDETSGTPSYLVSNKRKNCRNQKELTFDSNDDEVFEPVVRSSGRDQNIFSTKNSAMCSSDFVETKDYDVNDNKGKPCDLPQVHSYKQKSVPQSGKEVGQMKKLHPPCLKLCMVGQITQSFEEEVTTNRLRPPVDTLADTEMVSSV